MQKRIPILLTLLLLSSIIIAPISNAQVAESEDTPVVTETEPTKTSDSSSKKTSAELKAAREAKMEEQKTKREEAKAEREAFREEQKQKREDLKTELETRREEAKAEREANREEFKAKLAELKDQKKATIVERVDTRIAEKNQRITERLLGQLDRMSGILGKMEEKLTKASGGDASEVTAAIASARTAIATAQTAVTAQVGKVYSIEIGDEQELKTVVDATIAQFRSDMEVAIQSVKSAHDATKTAAQTLGAYREANPPVMPSANDSNTEGTEDSAIKE